MSIWLPVVRRWDTERPQAGAPIRPPNRSEGMSYIDGFVIAVPTANKQKFIEHARQLDPLFIELGAIRVIEGWGDDVPDGKVTDFRRAVQATAEETVAFSWVEWPDKATRDVAMKKMIEDPRMDPSTPGNPPMPFDGKRMIFGGFEQVVEVKA
jgi:uncharacterized protein YbaA (DUF1428 family)